MTGCDPTNDFSPLDNVEIQHDDSDKDMDFDVSDQDDYMDTDDFE